MPHDLDKKFFTGALILFGLGVWGLWHTYFGHWRPGPGGGPMAIPRIMFLILIPASLALMWQAFRTPESCQTETVPMRVVGAVVIWALLYFWMVRNLGLVSSTAIMLSVAMIVLSPRPIQSLKVVLPVTILSSGAFWVMFTQIAPVLQVRVWFF
ncbi:MAG: tripartite tricarboxylate transporter TctB family protein [Roseinatronobacter sp.]